MSDTHIDLKEPFWSAGDRYHWTNELGERTGYGVPIMALIGEGKLYVKTRGAVYVVDKELAKEACQHYNAYFTARGKQRLAVVPACLFDKVI